jgi:hypothetical protein
MLTSAQFEAIGRLTLVFNEIELLFESYMAAVLTPTELRLGSTVGQEGTCNQKGERFKRILAGVCEEYPQLDALVNPMREKIQRARELSEDRNEYVHAIVVHDFSKNETGLRKRGKQPKQLSCDEKVINNLAKQMRMVVDEINALGNDLLMALEVARQCPRWPSGKYNPEAPSPEG